MRMLSVANVATLLGGTGRCALDCCRALPDWEHLVLFMGGPHRNHRAEFLAEFKKTGIRLEFGRKRVQPLVGEFKPDVLLYHNTGSEEMPKRIPHPARRIYYQHSRHRTPTPFDQRLMVSRGLANACGFGHREVLHQPVGIPPGDGLTRELGGQTVVGKLCTPTKSKWPANTNRFYDRLLLRHPNVRFEFVGTPAGVQHFLAEKFGDRVRFHPARCQTQSLLWTWHAMLHDGPWESYGRTICEAQQAGCIPITRSHGGTTEQIDHGDTGFLITGQDFEQWSKAIRQVEKWNAAEGMFVVKSSLAQFAGRSRGSLEEWASGFQKKIGIET